MESTIISRNEARVQGVSCKNVFSAGLLRGRYLFEILQTSLTVKTRGKCGKNWMFRKTFATESANFFWK